MVAKAEGGDDEITLGMDARPGRESVITIGPVTVRIVPVSNRGHAGWRIVAAKGAKIHHRKLDAKADNPLPCQ